MKTNPYGASLIYKSAPEEGSQKVVAQQIWGLASQDADANLLADYSLHNKSVDPLKFNMTQMEDV